MPARALYKRRELGDFLISCRLGGGMFLAFGHRAYARWPNAQRLVAAGRQEGSENIYRVSVKPS